MNVAIYVRVSTKGQELENQLLQLRNYCEKSDWNIYKEYTDVISGKEESRPSYDILFSEAHKKLFDGVVFWSLDRFARSGTLFTLQKLKELDNLGIFWHSYQDQYLSTAGQWKDVIISIMATLAKIERERISERTKAGLERAREKGVKLGRKAISEDVIQEVVSLLKKGIPYRKISEQVTYKTKYGKVHNISLAQISQIKKQFCSENGCGK